MPPPQLRVPFGLQDDTLVEPCQVSNGKACGCICPACKRPLIARQGAKTPHFAHAPGEDCAGALETAVHLAAKKIIAARQEIRLPAVTYSNPYARYNYAERERTKTIYVERIVKLDAVAVEYWLGDMRPDIVANIAGQDHLVEIAVTHFVDFGKKEKIRQRQLPAFEIDAGALKNSFTFATLTDLLYVAPYTAEWLYHPRTEALALEDQQKDLAIQKAIEELHQQERQKGYERDLEFDRYRRYREQSSDRKLSLHLRQLGLTERQLFKLTTSVPCEESFGALRSVWQSAVLVYLARQQEKQDEMEGAGFPVEFNPEGCLDWLRLVFTINPETYDGESIAFWKYIDHLACLEILTKADGGAYEIKVAPKYWVISQ